MGSGSRRRLILELTVPLVTLAKHDFLGILVLYLTMASCSLYYTNNVWMCVRTWKDRYEVLRILEEEQLLWDGLLLVSPPPPQQQRDRFAHKNRWLGDDTNNHQRSLDCVVYTQINLFFHVGALETFHKQMAIRETFHMMSVLRSWKSKNNSQESNGRAWSISSTSSICRTSVPRYLRGYFHTCSTPGRSCLLCIFVLHSTISRCACYYCCTGKKTYWYSFVVRVGGQKPTPPPPHRHSECAYSTPSRVQPQPSRNN